MNDEDDEDDDVDTQSGTWYDLVQLMVVLHQSGLIRIGAVDGIEDSLVIIPTPLFKHEDVSNKLH